MAQLKQPPKGDPKRARNYCFRISFSKGFFRLLDPSLWNGEISYCIYQLECGNEGTLHFQGYLECVGKKSWKQLHLLEGLETSWFGVRQGTGPQAIAYCKKQDETYVEGPWEYGEAKQPGKRCDLEDIRQKVVDRVPITTIWNDHYGSMIRYHRSVKEFKRIITPKRNWLTKFIIILGPTRCGKSTLARAMAPDAFWKTAGKWWDDYDGESAIVWDEFRGQYPYRELLRVLDSTPLNVECKGSHHQFVADLVIFTTNHHPSTWYDGYNIGHENYEESPLAGRLREYGEIIDMRVVKPVRVLGISDQLAFDGQPMLGSVFYPTEKPEPNPTQPKRQRHIGPAEANGLPRIQGG